MFGSGKIVFLTISHHRLFHSQLIFHSVANFCSTCLAVSSKSQDLSVCMWLACTICIERTTVAPKCYVKLGAGTSMELLELVDPVLKLSGVLFASKVSSIWINLFGPGWSSDSLMGVFIYLWITLCNSSHISVSSFDSDFRRSIFSQLFPFLF